MSAFDLNRPVPLGAATATQLTSVVERVLHAFRVWNSARLTEKELMQLSERELDDIGLTRGDISEVAARLARR